MGHRDSKRLSLATSRRFRLDSPMTMPQPGDPCPGFMAETGRCWTMVYADNLQATHCRESPSFRVGGCHTERRQVVAGVACPDHLDGLTGLRKFGRHRPLDGVRPPPNARPLVAVALD